MVPTPSIHATDITQFSSTLHSMELNPNRLNGSRRHRSTPRLTTATTDVRIHTDSGFPERCDSLNKRDWKAASQSPVITPSSTPSPSLSTPLHKPVDISGTSKRLAVPQPRVSIIASTFRKLRGRHQSTAGEEAPALPESPFPIPAPEHAALESRNTSLGKGLLKHHAALRAAHSDSNVHQYMPSYPPRELHDADKQFHSNLHYQHVTILSSRPAQAEDTVPSIGQASSELIGSPLSSMRADYTFPLDLPPHKEVVAGRPSRHGGNAITPADVDSDEVFLDAGVVIMREDPILVLDICLPSTPTEPVKTEAQQYKDMILRKEEAAEASGGKRSTPSPLSIASSVVMLQEPVSSATETAFSSRSGTEAGSESPHAYSHDASARPLRRSVSLTITRPSIDGIDFGEADGILKVLFPGHDEVHSANWNRTSFGIPLAEGSSPNLSATMGNQVVPPLTLARRGSTQVRSRSLQRLPHPVNRDEQQQPQQPRRPRLTPPQRKKTNHLTTGLLDQLSLTSDTPQPYFRATPLREAEPSQKIVREKRSKRSDSGDVLQNYAELAHLIGLKDGE